MAEEQNLTGTSFADIFIQFLADEQEKGNKRFKATLDAIFEPVFPGFSKAIDDLLEGAGERKKQLEETFGLTGVSPGEAALGFGVGSIKGIRGLVTPKGFRSKTRVQLSGKEITKSPGTLEDIKAFSKLSKSAADLEATTGQENFAFDPFIKSGGRINIGGIKPPIEVLEAKAFNAAIAKRTQARVKRVQKDLDRLAIAETNPLIPQSLIQQIAKKGLRAKASTTKEIVLQVEDSINDRIVISFKSKTATVNFNDEFAILSTPDGQVLAINFNSPTIKSELRSKFKEAFPRKFLADEIGQEFQPGELQRMAGETAKDAPPPDNFSYYSIENFNDGLQLINRMLDIAQTEKVMIPIKKQLDNKLDDLIKTFERIVKEGEKPTIMEIVVEESALVDELPLDKELLKLRSKLLEKDPAKFARVQEIEKELIQMRDGLGVRTLSEVEDLISEFYRLLGSE